MVAKQGSPQQCDVSLSLGSLVPKDNLYRRLKQQLDLGFLYAAVTPYYGKCGQQSIDPVVFFKLLLVGHLENLLSDRAIIRTSQLRLDILYFLDYSVGQPLPWHSTLSRTRQRLPESLFEACFQRVLTLCVEAGMVSGDTQAIDSAFVEASASLDTLKASNLAEWSLEKNPALETSSEQLISFKITANPNKLTRNNRTHRSNTDSEARLAQKPGKPFGLYYLSSMAVDTAHHVITHIQADMADEKDSRHLMPLVSQIAHTLQGQGLPLQSILADSGFSSGENCAGLESRGLVGYVSISGVYKPDRGLFIYQPSEDAYVCSQGKALPCVGLRMEQGYCKFYYYSKTSDCGHCPIKADCCGKRRYKQLSVSAFRNYYQRMQARLSSPQGQRMKKRRSATVEPVFGSLLNYYGMRRSNARGKAAAHKNMVMAATAYNLKKYLAFAGGPKAKVRALTRTARGKFFCPYIPTLVAT
jgi:transposase